MRVTNIKLHTAIASTKKLERYKLALTECECYSKKRHSFLVLRSQYSYVYTCFYSGHINVTGIKNFAKINSALRLLKGLLSLSGSCRKIFLPVTLDNIYSAWPKILIDTRHNLTRIKEIAHRTTNVIYTSFNRERFPALCIKTSGYSGSVPPPL